MADGPGPCPVRAGGGGRLRIAHIHGSDSGGGAELAAYELHLRLRALGHESTLFVGRSGRSDPHVVEIPRRRGPRGLLRATRWLERTFGLQYLYSPGFRRVDRLLPADADVLHIHSLHGADAYADIGMLPRLARRWPVVLTLQDMWMLTGHCAYPGPCQRWLEGCGRCPDLTAYPAIPRDGTRWNWLRKRHVLGRLQVTVVAPSEWLAQRVRSSPLLAGQPLEVVPNAVDTDVFKPAPDRERTRARLGLPADGVVGLMVANLLASPWKGIDQGVEALNRVRDPRLTVALVGNPAPSVAASVRHPVKVAPHETDRSRLAEWYAAADFLVMPSLQEVFGMVAAEAMACGTPVVAYATGGLPEVLGEDEGGLLVGTGDVAGLAGAIEALVKDEPRRQELGRRAVRRAAERFSLAGQARRFEALYRRVSEGGRDLPQ